MAKKYHNRFKIVTLDGQERTLDPRDLCIRDAERAVALAGVMGGQATEIDDASTNVFLESAVFRPGTIRKTSRRLGLSSESSYRFERGIDHKRSIWALDRACAMMVAAAGGKVCPGYTLAEPKPFVPVQIEFRPARANALLGVELSRDFDEKVLSVMGCAIEKTSNDSWQVTQPSWRPDLTREADLIEEVGRVHGLDTIAPELPAFLQDLGRAGEPMSTFQFWSRLRHWGAGLGLNEAVNYSFVGHKDLDLLGLPAEGRISIMNPLSAERSQLRSPRHRRQRDRHAGRAPLRPAPRQRLAACGSRHGLQRPQGHRGAPAALPQPVRPRVRAGREPSLPAALRAPERGRYRGGRHGPRASRDGRQLPRPQGRLAGRAQPRRAAPPA